jgi:hypothetical protein
MEKRGNVQAEQQQIANQRIAEQMAKGNEVRPEREKRQAWRTALDMYSLIQNLGIEISNPDSIAQKILADHIAQQAPIPFVGFWGVGDKPSADAIDNKYLDELNSIRQSVQRQYEPGTSITIIMADLHGQFNGFIEKAEDNNSSSYLAQIAKTLAEQNFQVAWLRDLYRKYSLQLPNINDPIKFFDNYFSRSEVDAIYSKHKERYVRSANSHHQHDIDPKQAAYYYVEMRLNEREMLQREYSHSFLLINGTKMASEPLLPKSMPILYLNTGPVWFKKE